MRPVSTRRVVSLLALCALTAVLAATPAHAGPADAYYAADTDGVFWFMHISDIHTSSTVLVTNWEPESTIFALNEGYDVIQPVFIVATGDLVDGSRSDLFPTSGQAQSEWDAYKDLLTGAGMTTTTYYDVIGNHDLYVPAGECPSLHWYLNNSLQGQATGSPHFSWTHTTTLGDYFFYAIDMDGDCRRSFNTSDTNGVLVDSEYNAIVAALDANTSADLIFVFGHQNPTEPNNAGRLMDHLVQHGVFYVHGHAHEYKEYLAGNASGDIVVNEVNSLGQANADNIAVGVIDHNAFIYRATDRPGPWPFVIITAPVATNLRDGGLNPWAYDVCKDRVNPFRALVFSKQNANSVTVKVGGLSAVPMTNVSGSFWTASVDTSALTVGQQNVVVSATAGGQTRSDTISAEFYACPQQDAGVQQDATPQQDAQHDAAPPQDDAAPPQDDAAPPQDDAAPPQQDATPPQSDAGVQQDGSPAQQDGSPAQQDGSPAQQDGSPAQQDATVAPDGATGDGSTADVTRGGCACRTAAAPERVPGAALLVIMALGVALRVRRRRS